MTGLEATEFAARYREQAEVSLIETGAIYGVTPSSNPP